MRERDDEESELRQETKGGSTGPNWPPEHELIGLLSRARAEANASPTSETGGELEEIYRAGAT